MADAAALKHHIDAQLQPHEWDAAVAALAEGQHGAVAYRQLLELGLGRGAIQQRLKRGRLHRVYRGVYAVGHRLLALDGWRMAAVLACGPKAVLSHRSAAALHGLRRSAEVRTEVTVPFSRHATAGIVAHAATLLADEVTTVRGIPVTTVPRTILDNASILGRQAVERLIHEAEVLRLTDPLSLHDLLARYPSRAGTAVVRAALASTAAVPKTVIEQAFVELLRRHRLPLPELNVWLTLGRHRHEVDCLWRAARVVVELDGRAVHDTARRFESDREKDRRLTVARWRPLRVTWHQIHDDARALVADLAVVLS